MKKQITTLLLGLICNFLFGQFTVYNSPTTAPAQTNGVCIDNTGTKWITSQYNGLFKFDGTTWTVYNSGNTASMPSTPLLYVIAQDSII